MDVKLFCFVLGVVAISGKSSAQLPTVYEYYTNGGVKSGLEALETGFKLNGKDIVLQSGAIHYFRVHPAYWRDRLKKLRATGLIAVETYVPWNLHEPEKDVFDLGDGGRDMSEFLDFVKYIKMAQEEDLLVFLRPGPYICAEWDKGGLPSWLNRIPGIKMRSSQAQYQERADKFLTKILAAVKDLQFTLGGPIIAFQLENEFSSVGYLEGPDQQHLKNLKALFDANGIVELLFTSDNTARSVNGTIPEALQTTNFQSNAVSMLNALKNRQPDKPVMVMEFWTGWFDHWMQAVEHDRFPPADYAATLETIIKYPASFNLYMFHGGTSFGFMNGGNEEIPTIKNLDVTSYDYAAPLSESGDYTEKYNITKQLVAKYAQVQLNVPEQPAETEKFAYPDAVVTEYLALSALWGAAETTVKNSDLLAMEELPTHNDNGQSYGVIWYRSSVQVKPGDVLKISGHVHDFAQVYVDNKMQTKMLEAASDISQFGFWRKANAVLNLTAEGTTLDIVVENLGRINFGTSAYRELKGLYDGPVTLNGTPIDKWDIAPFDFKRQWLQSLSNNTWSSYVAGTGAVAPGLYKINLRIPDKPKDTFLDMQNWVKGLVFVNGFNLGRYNVVGPQRALYLPAPLLRTGDNQIVVYEQYRPADNLVFSSEPKLG